MAIFTGRTVNEAKEKGLRELRIDERRANIRVLQEPRKGILGQFSRNAKVEITLITDREIARRRKQRLKSNLLMGGLMVCCLIFLGITEVIDSKKPGLEVPESSESFTSQNYQVVVEQLKGAGFTNITTEKIEDLVTGWLVSDGEVEKVLIGSEDNFSEGDKFNKDVKIVVTYHTFKKEVENNDGATSSEETKDTTQSVAEVSSQETTPSEEEILTPEHPDFSYILTNYDESKAKEFVEKYKGRIVEFDGHIAYTAPHGDYDTRFDFLLEAGDWIDENTSNYTGVSMTFENVNFYDLNFIDGTESAPLGLNLHIKARIVGSAKLGQLIYLDPIELSSR